MPRREGWAGLSRTGSGAVQSGAVQSGAVQAQPPGGAPQTAGLLSFEGGAQPLFPGGQRRLGTLLMPLNPLLYQDPGHVADRAGLLISQSRQTGTEVLRQDHLNSRGFWLPA